MSCFDYIFNSPNPLHSIASYTFILVMENQTKPTPVLLVSDQPLGLEKRREIEKKENIKIIAYHRIITHFKLGAAWIRRPSFEINEIIQKVLSDERISAVYYFLQGEISILELGGSR